MEIDPINSINKIQKAEQVNKTNKVNSKKKDVDKVNISPEARIAAENAKLIDIVKNSSDVRENRIAELKKKINSQAYLSEALGDKLASRIAESLGINLG